MARTLDRSTENRYPADLIEAGNALRRQPGTFRLGSFAAIPERQKVIVIGSGQAGLAVGYHLKRRGIDHVILEGADRIGDVWRNRWDSLRLFTPAKFDGLDGLRFPAHGDHFPTKDEMADCLEAYAAHHALPIRTGTYVERSHRANERSASRLPPAASRRRRSSWRRRPTRNRTSPNLLGCSRRR